MSTEKTQNNPVYAGPASKDGLARFYTDAMEKLKKAGIRINQQMRLVLGVRKWNSIIGHRAVIVQCTELEKCAFRLELEIDTPQDNVAYIQGSFSCPDVKCQFEEKTFTELANHHLCNHRNQNPEDITHGCCGQNFPFFELFLEHVYSNHRDLDSNFLCLNFEKVRPEKYEKFLSPESVQFYPTFELNTSFKEVLKLAEKIILGFERYWIFMWNCQDFAAWYLYTSGVPLRLIDPTTPDKVTGSGKDRSARKVQGFKSWAWYKERAQLEKFNGRSIKGANYTCSLCPYLPPLTVEALTQHHNFAHSNEDTEHSSLLQLKEVEICHHLCGIEKGLYLETEPTRKWELYRLRGSSVDSHTSLVLRPWIVSEDKEKTSVFASNLFVSIEKRLNFDNSSCLFVGLLDRRHVQKLERICEIEASIQEVVDYISLIFLYMHTHRMIKNCIAFAYYLSKVLYGDKIAGRSAFLVDSQYTRHRSFLKQRLSTRLEKELDEEWGVEDIHSTVGSETLDLKGRTALLLTLMHRKYNAMIPIHVMFLLVLTHFDTIGELIFPLIVLFTVYFSYALVFAEYRKFGSRWLLLHSAKTWDTEVKLRLLRDALHVISMCLMTCEVAVDLDRLKSMILMQLMWLYFLFDNREKEKKCQALKGLSQGAWKPSFVNLLKDNIHKSIFRMLMFITFLLPANIQVSFIFVETVIMIACSRKYRNRLALKHVTGHKHLEFQLAYFVFILSISAYIVLSGYYVQHESFVSNIHILFLVTNFAISFKIDLKDASQKFRHAMNINRKSDIGDQYGRLRFHLHVLQMFIMKSLGVLVLGTPVMVAISDFKLSVLFSYIVMYSHCIFVGLAFDIKDALLSSLEK